MENLLLVINDGTLNDKPLRFACYLAQITRSRLQGILLTNTSEKELYPEEMIKKKSNASAMLVQMQHVGSDNEEDIQCFRRICEKEGIAYDIRCLKGDPLREAVSESRFADLMVIGGTSSPDAEDDEYLTPFAWSLLQVAECPVVVVSDQTPDIEEIVLTYDGSASSLFAFRRFAHLFPCFESKRVIVVAADRFPELKHERLIRDQLEEFYSQITFEMLYSRDFDKELFDFYQRRRNCFIVMGAAGRTSLSRLMADGKMYLNREVMEHPVFIAHF